MLLFTKQRFVERILRGVKTFEIRYGQKYRTVKTGDSLSINGAFRLTVTKVETLNRRQVMRYTNEADLSLCYPKEQGPFYVFHFDPPTQDQSRLPLHAE